MVRLVIMLLVTTVVSGYYFPFGFFFLPDGINTKMILAVIGAILFIYHRSTKHQCDISKELLVSIAISLVFSLLCLYSCEYNNTEDYAYATYIISFFTWLGGAYTVCASIRAVHGEVTLKLLTGYLTFVCACQCLLALLIDRIPTFQLFVDTYINQGQAFFQEVGRLYGIGAALDTAGIRFSVCLLLIAYLLSENKEIRNNPKDIIFLLSGFFIISVIGNIISRTTVIGTVAGVCYIICSTRFSWKQNRTLYTIFGIGLVCTIALSVYFYVTDLSFHSNMRFAFEGFFNWAETGEWRTDSTDKLNREMWIWPQTTAGWIVGTGLFDNWIYGTDIGYCRFILYSGLLGFSAFASLFIYNAWSFSRKTAHFLLFSLLLLALSFIIWFKVATDLFFIYALFHCLDWERSKCENEIELA